MKLYRPIPVGLRRLVVIGLVVAFPPATEGTEWFVAPAGAVTGTGAFSFDRIQDGLNAAQPGDVITVRPGTYTETIRTVRHGLAERPVVLRAEAGRGSVVVTAPGNVLMVNHAYLVVDGLVFDGQFGEADIIDVNRGADYLVLRNSEVRRSSRDAIDIAQTEGVLIENCLIHHALNPTGGRSDAHGIVTGAVRGLTIRDTEIHTFSGDAIQLGSGRTAPGWNQVTIDGGRFWLAPLRNAENGFAAGTVPGENAVDTKANSGLPRARIIIRNTVAWGFRGGLIDNMAAFNLKENIDATVDGVTVRDSEIAFRLRGPTSSHPAGARVVVRNAVVHDVTIAFRYENEIDNLRIWNNTLGFGVTTMFHAASSSRRGLDVRNLLVLGSALSAEASHASNLAVGVEAFLDAPTHNYRLSAGSAAIDVGETIAEIVSDRLGTARPQGKAFDVGAYERR